MIAKDFIELFPSQSFSQVFNKWKELLLSKNVREDQILNKQSQFNSFFKLDDVLLRFKNQMDKCPELEISKYQEDLLVERINFLKTKIDLLNQPNLENLHDINSVFRNFENHSLGEIGEINNSIKELESELISLEGQCKNKELEDRINLLDDLTLNKETFEQATMAAQKWLQTKSNVTETGIQESMNDFENKANEHRSAWTEREQIKVFGWSSKLFRPVLYFGISWWLLGAFLGAVLAAGISWKFILEVKNMPEIGIGAALIRIAVLIVPYSIAVLCAQQFLSHRKLYEGYKFKHIALGSMRWLIKNEFPEPSDERRDIIKKATDIIFQEPYTKDEVSGQKKVISDLRDILKERLSK